MKQRSWVSASNVIVLLTLTMVLLVLFWGNPYSPTWWIKCPLYQLTGWQCPLCGMQRQLHALMHFRFSEAWCLNAGLFFTYPYWGLLLLGQLSPRFRASKIGEWCYNNKVILTFIVLLLVWGIIRNII
ncbi:MAG: DUF2752 domain-containing protein [Bacteroidaceae bacterium]|nr:DUF2752 domain-containing protein [Bacteroidaceae bacterium]